MAGIVDVYTNFFTLQVTSGATSTDLITESSFTSLGMSQGIGWEIHKVEIYFPAVAAVTGALTIALTTRRALAAMPNLNDKGLIVKTNFEFLYSASGMFGKKEPWREAFLPPILIAAPRLSMYVQGTVNTAWLQSKVIPCRISFTQVALDKAAMSELWQTWNFAD